jgi:tetratricopeptide (TPR) repeat protein
MARVQLFLSTVSAEFKSYRDRMRHLLTRPDVEVKVQEDFIVTGDETLEMLDHYIQGCDGVIHLVGDMTGSMAKTLSVAATAATHPELASRFPLAEFVHPDGPSLSYTQWEAWLALLHGKRLFIAKPAPEAPRDERYRVEAKGQELQQAHLDRLRSVGRYPGTTFSDPNDLAAEVMRSFVLDLLVAAGLTRRPTTLPFASIGSLFKGRVVQMGALETASKPIALIGNGGVGKTRLAIEHAWRQVSRRNAVLLISAGSAEALNRNLAALCQPDGLDLPQQSVREETVQRDAVLHWLQTNPGWLLIFDSVDTAEAAVAIEGLLPRFTSGQVVITTRLSNWSAAMQSIEVDVLAREDAITFLLERTSERRRQADEDATTAAAIAVEDLGGLALALEQAGAYISQRRLSLAAYRSQWQSSREQVLLWRDAQLMQYDRSLATTWLTSYRAVSDGARTLLRRLAWLSPEPIPESLLEVAVPIDAQAQTGVWEALVELEGWSLVNRSGKAPLFTVHRLVQEVSRLWQQQSHPAHGLEAPEANELLATLGWINAAFVGDPLDVRSWPVLEPLSSHALAVAGHGDGSGLTEPTARLFAILGGLLYARAMHGQAEPLMRRALAISEASYGPDHPDVATDLNNLAGLLLATNRLSEAEPLMRRALSIDEASNGPEHPNVARDLNNLAQLLQDTNRPSKAEPLMRRALAIDEARYGPEHSEVATDLNNLAQLLQATNRLAEAEPLMRRALAIDEASNGPEHPNVARDLNNLAQLLQDTNRLSEAEPLMLRALAIAEASYGPEHPEVAIRLNNLAQLLQATNRLSEAEPLMHRALAIDEARYGPDHPDLAIRLNNLAQLLKAINRLSEAEPLSRRCLVILSASLRQGYQHPHLQAASKNYASVLVDMGLSEEEAQTKIAAIISEATGKLN